jgi:TonB dependent receptor.
MPTPNLSLTLQGNYVSRQYLDNTSNQYRSLDPYYVSNFHIDYAWQQKVFKNLRFSLSINNLFNAKYATYGWIYRAYTGGAEYLEDGYFPQAGRNFMLGISIGI